MAPSEEKSGFPIAFLVGGLVVLLIFGGIFLFTEKTKTAAPVEQHLALDDAAKTYTARIHIGDFRMSRAENMLGHELTYIVGTLTNNGTRTIRDIEVTVEFRDMLGQVVLREIRRPFGRNALPLGGGQSRDFQLTFEGVPRDWNVQFPTFRVSGLVLE